MEKSKHTYKVEEIREKKKRERKAKRGEKVRQSRIDNKQ